MGTRNPFVRSFGQLKRAHTTRTWAWGLCMVLQLESEREPPNTVCKTSLDERNERVESPRGARRTHACLGGFRELFTLRLKLPLGQMASSTAALTARVRPGGPWQITNNVVTTAENTNSLAPHRPTWARSASGADGDVHHFYQPATTIATNQAASMQPGQQASNGWCD